MRYLFVYIFASVVTLAWLPLSAMSEETGEPSPDTVFREALFAEEVERDLVAAIRGYREIVAAFEKQRVLAATALFRLAECYRKTGDREEAVRHYRELVASYGDQETLAKMGKENLRALGEETGGREEVVDRRRDVVSKREVEELERIEKLLQQSPDLLYASDSGKGSPLEELVRNGSLGVLEALAKKGVDLSVANGEGKTLLHVAASAGHREIARFLLVRGLDINAVSKGHLPLTFAVANDRYEITKLLLEKGAQLTPSAEVIKELKSYPTPLGEAIRRGHHRILDLLLDSGADPVGTYHYGSLVLFEALAKHDLAVVKKLLDHGVDPDTPFGNDRLALVWAVEKGHPGLCEILIGAGATLDKSQENGETPLSMAVKTSRERKDSDIVKMLLEKGADPNGPMGEKRSGMTPLMALVLVSDSGNNPFRGGVLGGRVDLEVLDLLLKAGADPNGTDVHGLTVLHRHVVRNIKGWDEMVRVAMVEKLVGAGADLWNSGGLQEGQIPVVRAWEIPVSSVSMSRRGGRGVSRPRPKVGFSNGFHAYVWQMTYYEKNPERAKSIWLSHPGRHFRALEIKGEPTLAKAVLAGIKKEIAAISSSSQGVPVPRLESVRILRASGDEEAVDFVKLAESGGQDPALSAGDIIVIEEHSSDLFSSWGKSVIPAPVWDFLRRAGKKQITVRSGEVEQTYTVYSTEREVSSRNAGDNTFNTDLREVSSDMLKPFLQRSFVQHYGSGSVRLIRQGKVVVKTDIYGSAEITLQDGDVIEVDTADWSVEPGEERTSGKIWVKREGSNFAAVVCTRNRSELSEMKEVPWPLVLSEIYAIRSRGYFLPAPDLEAVKVHLPAGGVMSPGALNAEDPQQEQQDPFHVQPTGTMIFMIPWGSVIELPRKRDVEVHGVWSGLGKEVANDLYKRLGVWTSYVALGGGEPVPVRVTPARFEEPHTTLDGADASGFIYPAFSDDIEHIMSGAVRSFNLAEFIRATGVRAYDFRNAVVTMAGDVRMPGQNLLSRGLNPRRFNLNSLEARTFPAWRIGKVALQPSK